MLTEAEVIKKYRSSCQDMETFVEEKIRPFWEEETEKLEEKIKKLAEIIKQLKEEIDENNKLIKEEFLNIELTLDLLKSELNSMGLMFDLPEDELFQISLKEEIAEIAEDAVEKKLECLFSLKKYLQNYSNARIAFVEAVPEFEELLNFLNKALLNIIKIESKGEQFFKKSAVDLLEFNKKMEAIYQEIVKQKDRNIEKIKFLNQIKEKQACYSDSGISIFECLEDDLDILRNYDEFKIILSEIEAGSVDPGELFKRTICNFVVGNYNDSIGCLDSKVIFSICSIDKIVAAFVEVIDSDIDIRELAKIFYEDCQKRQYSELIKTLRFLRKELIEQRNQNKKKDSYLQELDKKISFYENKGKIYFIDYEYYKNPENNLECIKKYESISKMLSKLEKEDRIDPGDFFKKKIFSYMKRRYARFNYGENPLIVYAVNELKQLFEENIAMNAMINVKAKELSLRGKKPVEYQSFGSPPPVKKKNFSASDLLQKFGLQKKEPPSDLSVIKPDINRSYFQKQLNKFS